MKLCPLRGELGIGVTVARRRQLLKTLSLAIEKATKPQGFIGKGAENKGKDSAVAAYTLNYAV